MDRVELERAANAHNVPCPNSVTLRAFYCQQWWTEVPTGDIHRDIRWEMVSEIEIQFNSEQIAIHINGALHSHHGSQHRGDGKVVSHDENGISTKRTTRWTCNLQQNFETRNIQTQ
jgi:hypothetical protein